jgi:hypothetical protein
MRWELLLSKRQIITMALVFFGLLVIPQILAIIGSESDSSTTMAQFAFLFLIIYYSCCGSNIFYGLRSRQQRINNFMLPASNKEKFIARYLILILVMPLAGLVGFLAGDLLQHVLTLIFGKFPALWATPELLHSYTDLFNSQSAVLSFNGSDTPFYGPMVLIVAFLFQHACFLLFGSIYHKQPLILSILTWIGLGILLITLLALGAKLISEALDSGYAIILYDNWCLAFYYIISLAVITFCYWFAYRRYTRLQVINNQWINK